MKKHNLDQQLAEFEARANDELALLNELGPVHFATSDLLDLDHQIEEKLAAFDYYLKRVVWIGLVPAVLLVVGAVCLCAGLGLAARIIFGVTPFSVAAFLGAAFFLKKNFNSRGHWLNLRADLQDELGRRRAKILNKG